MSFTKFASLESAQVLGVKGSSERVRTASLDKFSDFDNYRTEDGYLYARIRAISSRVNKNHDGWPSVELAGNKEIFDRHFASEGSFTLAGEKGAEYGYSTFLGKPVFVDHHNSDPSRARGVIVDAKLHVEDAKTSSGLDPYYASAPDNHLPPTWVELLLEVDAKSFPKLAKAIIDGSKNPKKGIDGFSMGCDVEKTQCNICRKFAYSPDDYCEHIRLKGAHFDYVDPDSGRKTSKKSYEDCYGIKFFEISAVFDPADETALLRELIHKEGSIDPEFLKDEHLEGLHEGDRMLDRALQDGCPLCQQEAQLQNPPEFIPGDEHPQAILHRQLRSLPETEHPLGPHTGKTAERLPGYDRWLEKPYMQDEELCPECDSPIEVESDGAHCPACGWAAGYNGPDRHEDMEPDWDSMPGGHDYYAKTANDDAAYQQWLEKSQPAQASNCPKCGSGGIQVTNHGKFCSTCGYKEAKVLGSRKLANQLRQAMTAKDFRMVADLIASAPINEDDRVALAQHAAGYLAQTNPNFDQERFLEAATGNPGGRDQFGGAHDYPTPPPEILSRTAEAPLPQSEHLHAPAELDTLRNEEICPVCGSTMDDDTCDICGYVAPPDGFDNPDLEKAEQVREQGDIDELEQPKTPPLDGGNQPAPDMPEPDIARNNAPTASVKSDMANWNVSVHPKVAGRINSQESPITTSTDAATDEPKDEVLKDETQPTTSRTAKEFIAAAGRKERTMSKQAAEPVPAAKPTKRVDVEGVGGVDEASNEQASKADAQVEVDAMGGTGVEDVAADQENVNVEQGDEHSKNIEEIPTKTWSGEKGQTDPVQGDVFPTAAARQAYDSDSFPKDDGGLGGGSAAQGTQPADPVGKADERVDLLDAVTSPANNSGPTTTWTGTDGNGVTKQQDPVTNETLEGDNIVNLNPGTTSSKKLFSAFKIADLEVELGILHPDRKYDRVAELEKKSSERVDEALEYAQRIRTAGLGKSRQVQSKRLPSFTQPTTHTASQSDEDWDDSVLFS